MTLYQAFFFDVFKKTELPKKLRAFSQKYSAFRRDLKPEAKHLVNWRDLERKNWVILRKTKKFGEKLRNFVKKTQDYQKKLRIFRKK